MGCMTVGTTKKTYNMQYRMTKILQVRVTNEQGGIKFFFPQEQDFSQ